MADGNPGDHTQGQDLSAGDLIRAAAINGGDNRDDDTENSTIIATASSSSNSLDALNSLISSVITDFDSRADATARSQDQLSLGLDRLNLELDKLLEDAPSPFIMQHASRISVVRKRVKALNTVLKSIQRRVDNMDQMLSAGLVHEKSDGGSTGPH